ncbi:MAG: glycoside hydrolase family 2 protein [Ilyomonas sp.]
MKKIISLILLLFIFFNSFSQQRKSDFSLVLKDDWNMQSSLKATAPGNEISQDNFDANNWYKVNVPTTLVAGLLANKVYDFDPFYGKNLEKMDDSSFNYPWWFRKEFTLPAAEKDKNIVLKLHGINYKANVWLNGKLLADSAQIKGPFRIIELDVTTQINKEGNNVLALEITRPFNPNKRDGDLAIDYADWIHYPPDYNGGIVNNIEIKTYDKVGIEYPLVTTHFDYPSLNVAHLTVDARVANYTSEEQDVTVQGKINDNIEFQKQVHLKPNEVTDVTFSPADFSQLNIKNPRIWWPWEYGKPELNYIELSVLHNNKISNTIGEPFGIREITSKLINNNKSRVFIVNGKPIMLRGAAWSPDIFQRRSAERQEQEIKLVRDMHMNIVRSEGKLEDDNFYDLCDRYGLLVMTGWMCCGAWQYPENWSAAEREVAMASDSSVMYWLRNKASIMVWLNGSDMPPTDTSVERDYLTIEKNLKWPNPVLSTATADVSKVSGYSGVKMNGPYDWVPPTYWESDTAKFGGAWSFATEISPGPAIPPYESLIKFIPKDSLWYTTSDWLYHCGTMTFGNTHIFDSALNERYGESKNIHEYVAKAQAQNYEAQRAMFEGYGLKKYKTATGVIQWMLSNPWPSLIWHTYDYYLYPAGSYFGTKKALEPLHVMYSYKTKSVNIINSWQQDFSNLKVKADVYNMDGTLKYSHPITTNVDADGTKNCFALPAINNLSDNYFVRLELKDAQGKEQSINWYWLSKKEDELNWKKSKWYYTPQSSFADFTSLQELPAATIKMSATSAQKGDSTSHTITVTNTGRSVAFFVHVRALKGRDGDDILPVLFSDNYLLLAPGETRTIQCSYANKDANNATPYFSISGWNLNANNSTGENASFVKSYE